MTVTQRHAASGSRDEIDRQLADAPDEVRAAVLAAIDALGATGHFNACAVLPEGNHADPTRAEQPMIAVHRALDDHATAANVAASR